MSDNPYQPSVESASISPSAKPGGLTPIAILCLLLGLMGLFGAVMGMLAPILLSFGTKMLEKLAAEGGEAGPQLEQQLKIMEMSGEGMMWGVAFSFINLFVALGLVVGSIMVLRNKSASILTTATLAAAIFLVVRYLVLMVMVQLPMMGKMKEVMGEMPGQGVGQVIGLISGGLTALAMIGFYVWSHYYLKKPAVTNFLASKP